MPAAALLNSTGIAVVSAVSLVFGYGLLWALWHYVFSPRNEHDDTRDRDARETAARDRAERPRRWTSRRR